MSRPLGATNCSCRKFKVHKPQSILLKDLSTQLVEYKALNLVDMGSSPMVEITSYDVIINESYTKSQLGNILLTRPLGATRCWSSLHDHIYKVPAHYCILTRHLGATYVEYSILTMIEMNKPDFFKVETLIGASLKLSLCYLLKTWGLQVLYI